MSVPNTRLSKLVCPESGELRLFRNVPGIVSSIHDGSGKGIWDNGKFNGDNGKFKELIYRDCRCPIDHSCQNALTLEAIDERIVYIQKCLEIRQEIGVYQVNVDTLFFTNLTPVFLEDLGEPATVVASIPCRFKHNDLPILKTVFLERLAGLSRTTLDVFQLLINGKSNEEIGKTLFRSTRTVEGHAAKILSKLKLATRAEAIKWGVSRGIESIPFETWQQLIPVPLVCEDIANSKNESG